MRLKKVYTLVSILVCMASNDVNSAYLEPALVKVNGGKFNIGSLKSYDTQPIKQISIRDFYVGKYEVTRKEFSLFIEDTEHQMPIIHSQKFGSSPPSSTP